MTPLPQREIVEFLYGASGSAPSFFLFSMIYFNESKVENEMFRNWTGKKLHFRVELTAEYTYASDTCNFGFLCSCAKKNVALRNREIFRSQALAGLWSGNYELIWPVCSVARISHLRVTFLPTRGNPNPAAARKSMSGFFIHEDFFFQKNVKNVIFTCLGFSLRCSFSASKMRVFVRSILIMLARSV